MKNNSLTYNFHLTEHFKKQLKRLLKKDRSVKVNLMIALRHFNKEHAIAVGKSVYKIRVMGLGKGKSGGYRAYLLVYEIAGILAPMCMYPKNERENLTYHEMNWHLEITKEELSLLFSV